MVDDTPIGRLVAKLAKKHKGDEARAFSGVPETWHRVIRS